MSSSGRVLLLALVSCAEPAERVPPEMLQPMPAPVVAPSASASTRPARIAITIDDLPWIGAVTPGETKLAATQRLLAHLRDRRIAATGFVVCGHATGAGASIVRGWQQAGMTLGNHTQWHRSVDEVPSDKWQRDLAACHDRLVGWDVGERFFRFPYLQQGATDQRRAHAKAALASLGYAHAPVTVNVFDWHFAAGYGAAVKRGDLQRAQQIAEGYVQFAVEATQRARETATRKVGRDVAHILLLHANLLAADHLGALLDALVGIDFAFVPLAEALKDPVYGLEDAYLGGEGFNWLYHVPPLDEDDMAWARVQSKRIQARFAK